jgi:Transglutaminase-like superfamily
MASPRTERHLHADVHSAEAHGLRPKSPRSLRERARLVCEIVAAYRQARRELRRAPIASVLATLRAESPPQRTAPAQAAAQLEEARRLGWIVAHTLKLMPGDTRCLARSLVLTRLLARRGIPSKLVIGARATPEFLAHAWVECDGQPVLSPGDGSLGRLVEL